MFPEWKSFEDCSFPYLNGNSFAVQCKHIWNYDGYKINPNKQNNWVYIKTDYIHEFFATINLDFRFVLLTGNSDFPITNDYLRYIENDKVIVWFAQNAAIRHPKLRSLPIGIAPSGYKHGDISVVNKVRAEKNVKEQLFYVNFSIGNNEKERSYCLEQIGLPNASYENGGWKEYEGGYTVPYTFEDHMRNLSKSFFCISPNGNGIDCHRTWESLYVKTIPIVTRSLVTEEHSDMPIIVLDDWSDFKKMDFSKDLYFDVWNNFNIGEIHMDNYVKRLLRNIS